MDKPGRGRKDDIKESGYYRVFNHPSLSSKAAEKMALIVSKAHATSISNGLELEDTFFNAAGINGNIINNTYDFDIFIENLQDPSFDKNFSVVISKKGYKDSLSLPKSVFPKEPDFMLYKNGDFYLMEMKDGDDFDAKKLDGEQKTLLNSMLTVRNVTNNALNYYPVMCSFSQTDQKKAVAGFKKMFEYFDPQSATCDTVATITGQDICKEFDIDFNKINTVRMADNYDNAMFMMNGIAEAILYNLEANDDKDDKVNKVELSPELIATLKKLQPYIAKL